MPASLTSIHAHTSAGTDERSGPTGGGPDKEIINGLLSDKSELVGIAQAYEQELVSQRISQENIEYLTTHLLPLVSDVVLRSAAERGVDEVAAAERLLAAIKPIFSVETVTILQLIGFNFREAIGQPLTELVARLITSRAQIDPSQTLELQELIIRRDIALSEVARDAGAHSRFKDFSGSS